MSDDADLANDHAQFAVDLALQQHLANQRKPQQIWTGGAVLCMDCGFAIPSPRLAALPDCVRCVDCQSAYEKGEKQCQ